MLSGNRTGAIVMLGLLGIFGALFAGLMADGVITTKATAESDDGEVSETERDDDAPHNTDEPSVDFLAFTSSNADLVEADEREALDISNTDSTDTPAAPAENQLISGESGDDILTGDGGADTINGGDGVDLLGGRDGDDLINGEDGGDYLDGGAGADTLLGGAGNDVEQGNDGNDLLDGGEGDDVLAGHMDDDRLMIA